MKRLWSALIMLLLALSFGGCCCKPVSPEYDASAFVGTWQIYKQSGDNLEALPVNPRPTLELLSGGVLKFNYQKQGTPMTATGRWELDGGSLKVCSESGDRSKSFKIISDSELEMTIGAGDAMPEGTVIVLQK